MNFVSESEIPSEHVELKSCERCGGLFLRSCGSQVVHCGGCALRLNAEPGLTPVIASGPRQKGRNARLSIGPKTDERDVQGMTIIGALRGVAMEVRPC